MTRPRASWLVVTVALLASCSGSAHSAEASVVRLAGEVCRVELIAGGVFVADHLVLTAAHPVAGASEGVEIITPRGDRAHGVVVGFDPARDLAVLRVEGLSGAPLSFAEGAADQSASIWAVDRDGEVRIVPAVIDRPITATGEDIYREGNVTRSALQLSAEIEAGMSGAPVVDDDGRVLGIVFASSRNGPVAYAVSAAEAQALLTEIDPSVAVGPGRCP